MDWIKTTFSKMVWQKGNALAEMGNRPQLLNTMALVVGSLVLMELPYVKSMEDDVQL
jgi:hypothetical protein